MSNGTGAPAPRPRASGLGAGTGAWNKASAFLREGVSETKPVTGEKLTPYLPLAGSQQEGGEEEGQAPGRVGWNGRLGRFCSLPPP